MTTAAVVISRPPRTKSVSGVRARLRRVPFENLIMFTMALAFYLAAAVYLVLHLDFMIGDALSRVSNAFDVLFTRDPHLAAIGFYWPPLPAFLDIPIIAFKPIWPVLATKGFAGSIEAALFGAGTTVLINSALRWAGVVRGMRWVLCVLWTINPMTILYATLGMGEGPFVFFLVASIVVFMRWSASNRASLLPLMGLLAGCACLCRYEAFMVTFILGVGVVWQSFRNERNWRRVETEAILFAIPALVMIGLWIGSCAVIMHDILYPIHAAGSGGAARASAYGVLPATDWPNAINFAIGHSVALFPAVVATLAAVSAGVLFRDRQRITGVILIASGLVIPVFDTWMIHRGGLPADLRYQIAVIPFGFLAGIYLLRNVKSKRGVLSSWLALAFAGIFGLSNAFTALTLSDPHIALYEQPALAAFVAGQPVDALNPTLGIIGVGASQAKAVERLDTDQGLILCDSANCFPIVVNAHDSKQFVVTSDRDFEAAAGQPLVYGVEYFLVPAPYGTAAFNRLNVLYPSLYENGGGFSTLVGQIGDSSSGSWRLYRITGPTGRG